MATESNGAPSSSDPVATRARVGAIIVLALGILFVMRTTIEGWIAGPLGRSYCTEIIQCDSHYTHEECVHDVAVDTLDGRPVREGCADCLTRAGCAGALSCSMCGFDGR